MNKSITNRNLTIANFVIVSYFILIWLISFYKIDIALIGVFKEMLTIPFLIAQIVFLVIGIGYLMKNQKNLLLIIRQYFISNHLFNYYNWKLHLKSDFSKFFLKTDLCWLKHS